LNRAKSPRGGQPYQVKVPFLPAAKRILVNYNYEIPILSNQKYNDHLKAVGKALKLNFALTSHVSRKTFCTVLANLGMPIDSIAVSVGHATLKQTLKTNIRFTPERTQSNVNNLSFGK